MPEPTSAASAAPPKQNETASGSADLLQLSGANPFASVLNTGVSSTTTQNAFDSSGGMRVFEKLIDCWINSSQIGYIITLSIFLHKGLLGQTFSATYYSHKGPVKLEMTYLGEGLEVFQLRTEQIIQLWRVKEQINPDLLQEIWMPVLQT